MRKQGIGLSLTDLRPYTSLVLGVAPPRSNPTTILADVLNDVEELLRLDPDGPRILMQRLAPQKDGRLTWGLLHYQEHRRPPWSSRSAPVDVLNNLVLVCVRSRYVALFLSDTAFGRTISRKFSGSGTGLSSLKTIEPGVLNAAFASGRALTLWLAGIHRRTTVKADSKILTGSDLRDALDPLDDQTYFHTAARWSTRGIRQGDEVPIGIAGRRSAVWLGPSRGWSEFRDNTARILEVLMETKRAHRSEKAPLPILAIPGDASEDLHTAYDMSLLPPEALAGLDDQTKDKVERWAYQASYHVVESVGSGLIAEIRLDGDKLGTIKIAVNMVGNQAQCDWEIRAENGFEDEIAEFEGFVADREWFQIRYESGHTLSDGTIWTQRFRDMPFRKWHFANFDGIDVEKEKPGRRANGRLVFSPSEIGRQDSLFCWIQRFWPYFDRRPASGWLACDDGSMEIADFIHLDIATPRLSLIHVKGSGSDSENRGLSVSAYEVVISQAVKNLRHLDDRVLTKGLKDGIEKEIGTLVWKDGIRENGRKGFLKALDNMGSDFERRVVIVQPSVRKDELESARKDQVKGRSTGRVARLRQLDALLLGAEANCNGLGADLLVIGDGTIRSSRVRRQGSRRSVRK